MDKFLLDFEEDLSFVLTSVRNRLLFYPDAYKEKALVYLNRYKIFEEAFKGNHMCFLLPFWLKNHFGLSCEVSRKLSEGFMFGLFYFILQDQIMDSVTGEYKGDLLPLGNLFMLDFIEDYRRLLPNNNTFWTYFRCYIDEWAYSVTWEQNEHLYNKNPYCKADLILVARKASPLKIPAIAACILGNLESEAEVLAKIIDHTVITFQLMDDYSDREEDLLAGNCSYFLWQVMQYCGVNNFSALSTTHINKAIYIGKVLDNILAIMYENHSFIQNLSQNYLYIIKFHEALIKSFENIVEKTYQRRNNALKGGFISLLG